MFVHDAPPAVNFGKTHRQPRFKRFAFAVRGHVDAPSQCRDEGNIPAASDLHIVKSRQRDFQPMRKTSPKSLCRHPSPVIYSSVGGASNINMRGS